MMSKRKQTPDVLAEILGGEAAPTKENVGRLEGSPDSLPETWEYRLVSFQDYHGWRPRFIHGRELKDWTSGPLIHDFIQAMGEEGWELVAASAGERMYGSADTHQLFFRRPK